MEKELMSLINSNYNIIFSVINKYFSNTEDLKDVQQEILFQVVKSYPDFRGECKFSTWLHKIAIHTCYQCKIKKELFVKYDAIGSHTLYVFKSYKHTIKDIHITVLERALKRLSTIERKFITLYYTNGLSTKEISEELSMSDGAVRVALMRARNKLESKITKNKLWSPYI